MSRISDPVLGNLEFRHSWKGTCSITFVGKEIPLKLSVQGSPDKAITAEQRKAYENALKRLPILKEYQDELVRYCQIDAPEGCIDIETIPFVVHPEVLLLTYEGGFGLLCTYDYEPEHGIAIYAQSSNGKILVGPQDEIL